MKICLAQTAPVKGNIPTNIKNHLAIIKRAVQLDADLIVFPELSITGYEPDLAQELAVNIADEIFNPFQAAADKTEITIGVGMPTKAIDGINISMLIFQPHEQDRLVYSKRLLHDDELPYFVSGNSQPFLEIKDKKIALGICYETLQREHFIAAKEHNAAIYIASVAKPDRGTDKAYLHFPSIAQEFQTPILMVNSVGYCDNFLSNGLSAIWNDRGELVGQLAEKTPGLLVYNLEDNSVQVGYQTISKG